MALSSDVPEQSGWRHVIKWLKRIFTPVALTFLVYLGYRHQDVLMQIINKARPDYLLMAVLGWAVLYVLSPIFLRILLRPYASFPGFMPALYININRLPARYIPGGIWHTVARAADLRDYGISKRLLTMVFILENAIALGVALSIGGLILVYFGRTGYFADITLYIVLGSAIGLALLPLLINRFVLEKERGLSWLAYSKAMLLIALYWCGAASIFVLYLSAFPGVSGAEKQLEIAGTYLFSWGIGFVAIFAPQGIGVFEFVAGDLLQSPYGLASIAVLLAGFRLVILAADLVAWMALRLTGTR